MKNIAVLFRTTLAEEKEVESCKKYFPVITGRSQVSSNQLVIPRYSALPFYKEFEDDIKYLGGKLINSYSEHLYVADLKNWYIDLEELTPKTWFELHEVPKNGGPFVLKGATNSKKHSWNTHMFAKDWQAASEVYSKLQRDGFVGYQDICIRQYTPLYKLLQGYQGLPITEEYRFFIYNKKVLCGAFYWSEWYEDLPEPQAINPDNVPKEFLQEVIERTGNNIPFYVIDVARTQDNKWIVIELNDAQQSGLSMNDPDILYSNLSKHIKNNS